MTNFNFLERQLSEHLRKKEIETDRQREIERESKGQRDSDREISERVPCQQRLKFVWSAIDTVHLPV